VPTVSAAEQRGEVEGGGIVEGVEQGQGVLLSIQDGEGLGLRADEVGDGIPGEWSVRTPVVLDALKGTEEQGGLREDVGQWHRLKRGDGVERGLRGGREEDGGAVMGAQFAEDVQDGIQKVEGERLNLVQDDDGSGESVELPTGGAGPPEEAFEELDGGGNDDGGIPVLGGEGAPERFRPEVAGIGLFGTLGELGAAAVVLQDDRPAVFGTAEDATVDLGRLLGDADERHGDDDAALAVLACVAQSERHPGEGLAGAGGRGEPEHAGGRSAAR